MKFSATDATVLDNDVGELHANATIAMKGPMDGVAVSGRARIVHGTVYIPNGNGPRQVDVDDPAVLSVVDTSDVRMQKIVNTESPLLENMTIDVKLSVARDTWARSPDANIEFYTQGPLTILKNKEDEGVSLDGVVNTERGEYAFLGRRFVLSHGSAIFTGGQDLNPLLQLGAQYTIQPAGRPALNINIAVNGTARKPVILLTSDAQPPLSQSDLLSYLAFGQSSTSLLSSSGNSGVSGGGSGNGTPGRPRGRGGAATAHGDGARSHDPTVCGHGGAVAGRGRVHDHAGGCARAGTLAQWRANRARGYPGRGR
jgi:translocation and assembly module TamB